MDTSSWSVADVSNYLCQIGLGKYSQVFAENDISGRELPYINDEYLIELGVTSIGHRIKIKCLVESIKNTEYNFPQLVREEEERDLIHPLPQNIYQKLFIDSVVNDDQNNCTSNKVECSICHRFFDYHVISYHQNVCKDTFNKCKTEFSRRSLNFTDEDIIDLLVGNVPSKAIKLEKCKFCGKKISPKLFEAHQKECKKRSIEKKKKELARKNEISKDQAPKSDYKERHNELIQEIKKKKMESRERVE